MPALEPEELTASEAAESGQEGHPPVPRAMASAAAYRPHLALEGRIMFRGGKERRREQAAAVAASRSSAAKAAADAEVEHQRALLEWCAATARGVVAGTFAPADSRIALKAGERALYVVEEAGLVEPRREAGHWQGANQGISVRVPGTKSMRYRVGSTRGTYAQGDEKPTLIDSGTLTITTRRAAFVGPKQNREWAWSKLLSFFDDDNTAWTGIAVSNRQKMSGIAYPPAQAVATRLYLELGAAMFNGTAAELVDGFDDELRSPALESDVAGPATLPGTDS